MPVGPTCETLARLAWEPPQGEGDVFDLGRHKLRFLITPYIQ